MTVHLFIVCTLGDIKISRGKSNKNRVNTEITAREVRLIDPDGHQVGIVPITRALTEAKDCGLDLVEISPNVDPPVCRIMNFGKFVYAEKKKASEAKKKQKQMQIKEIRLRPVTEEADFNYKLENVKRFLERGDKVKVTIRFRGRELAYTEQGRNILERIEAEVGTLATVDSKPRLEGRQMIMMLTPQSGKKT